MTFIEFKKMLLDAEITPPKFVGAAKSLTADGGEGGTPCISLQCKRRFRLFTSSSNLVDSLKASDKYIQSYKKKGTVPNSIAVFALCFVRLHKKRVGYRSLGEELKLKKQTKSGGFKKKAAKHNEQTSKPKETCTASGNTADSNKVKYRRKI